MDKTHQNFEPLEDASSKFFKFSSVVMFLGLFLYISRRVGKKSPDKKGTNKDQFPWFKFILSIVKHTLGLAKAPFAQILMRFGDFFYVNVYTRRVVFVSNDMEKVNHIMSSPDWIGRPISTGMIIRNDGFQDRGILLANGDAWKQNRRYTFKSMALQLGLGKKNKLEFITHEQMKNLLQNVKKTIKKTNNKVPVRNLFSLETINVIWRIVQGTEFSTDDPSVHQLITATDDLLETNFYQFWLGDWIKFLLLKANIFFRFHKIYKAQAVMKKYFTDVINRRLLIIQENECKDNEENFIDNFIRQIISKNHDNEKMKHNFTLENLMVILFDLFEAGVDTTNSTLEFAMMYLAMHPEVQKKMQEEIKNVIGEDYPSYYSYKTSLPYIQAVIQEIHRKSSIIPFMYRRAISDCYMNDTFIKKDTAGLVNLYSIHHDEKFWGDPQNFRPERFLSSGDSLDSSKLGRVIPFGGGKHVCLGEFVANVTIFTFLISILQKYTVHFADPNEEVGLEPNSSFTSRAKPFHVKFVPIQQ